MNKLLIGLLFLTGIVNAQTPTNIDSLNTIYGISVDNLQVRSANVAGKYLATIDNLGHMSMRNFGQGATLGRGILFDTSSNLSFDSSSVILNYTNQAPNDFNAITLVGRYMQTYNDGSYLHNPTNGVGGVITVEGDPTQSWTYSSGRRIMTFKDFDHGTIWTQNAYNQVWRGWKKTAQFNTDGTFNFMSTPVISNATQFFVIDPTTTIVSLQALNYLPLSGGTLSGALIGNTAAFNTFNGLYLGLGGGNGATNTAVGYQAGNANTTGTLNLFLGVNSGYHNTTGGVNTFSGYESGFYNTTGNSNTFTGFHSGFSNTTGGINTFSGAGSGYANTIGNYNTAIGYYAGQTNATGSNVTLLGYQADVSADGLSNATAIGSNAKVTANNTIQLGDVNTTKVNTSGSYTGGSFIKTGGTSSQFLMADGTTTTGSSAALTFPNGALTDSLVTELGGATRMIAPLKTTLLGISPIIRNSTLISNATATTTIGTFTNIYGFAKYILSAYINIVSGTGTVTVTANYTDVRGNAKTITFYSAGSTTAAVSTFSNFATLSEIGVTNGTAINIIATVTGTVTYDYSATIIQLTGNIAAP